jgi:hypothetical protein
MYLILVCDDNFLKSLDVYFDTIMSASELHEVALELVSVLNVLFGMFRVDLLPDDETDCVVGVSTVDGVPIAVTSADGSVLFTDAADGYFAVTGRVAQSWEVGPNNTITIAWGPSTINGILPGNLTAMVDDLIYIRSEIVENPDLMVAEFGCFIRYYATEYRSDPYFVAGLAPIWARWVEAGGNNKL